MENYQEIKGHLLHVFNLVAPDGEVQSRMAARVVEMEKAIGHNQTSIVVFINGCIHDGLRHGNW